MGDDWLGVEEGGETRRIDRADDLVRLEVEAALQRDIPVIPVLVGTRPVPSVQELPETLEDLSFRNGVEVRMDGSFEGQLARLIASIESVLGLDGASAPPAGPDSQVGHAGSGLGVGKLALAGVVGAALLLTVLLMLPDESAPIADSDDCSWNYEEDYACHFFPAARDGVYCVLDRQGAAVARIWVTEISESSISFRWSYLIGT